ncbi:hypothetical protein AAE478_002993 [Parahypoxylon ruwenzoriense]
MPSIKKTEIPKDIKPRKWTNFEMSLVLSLISDPSQLTTGILQCQGDHLRIRGRGGPRDMAAKLNGILNKNGRGKVDDGDDKDSVVTPDHVAALLGELSQTHKAAMGFIERQRGAGCLTRAKRLVFMRRIGFDGSMKEWITEGRRDKVYKERDMRAQSQPKPARRSQRESVRRRG